MWREELKKRDAAYWVESGKKEGNLVRMLEARDKGIQESWVSRDRAWLNSLHSYNETLRLMTHKQINLRATLEVIGKRQHELTKANAKIPYWAVKTMLGKKKVPLPYIKISDYVPYIIQYLRMCNILKYSLVNQLNTKKFLSYLQEHIQELNP